MDFYLDNKCKYCGGEVISFMPYEENGHTFCCKECADDFKEGKVFNEQYEKSARKGDTKMERSLEVMKEVVFQFDGDLEAEVFGVEIDAQSIVEDYKWMIQTIEEQQKEIEEQKQIIKELEWEIEGYKDAF